MKTNQINISTLGAVSECWLYQRKRCNFMRKGRVGDNLPTTEIENEWLLEEMNIPYVQISDSHLEFWSPELYEEEETTLPLYIPYEGGYRFIGNYTGNVITRETQEKAFAVQTAFIRRLDEEREKQEEKKLISKLLNELDGRPAVGVYRYTHLTEELPYEGGTIKLMPVYTLISSRKLSALQELYEECQAEGPEITWRHLLKETNYTLVLDLNKLPDDGILRLEVPAGMEGMFIGRDGWQVSQWCTEFGLKQINVAAK